MATVSVPLPTGYTNDGPKIKLMPDDTILLIRKTFTDYSTIGQFLIDGDMFCYSLELSCRKENPSGKLAINAGKYELQINSDPITDLEKKFGFTLPTLLNVPNRLYIHIHPLNNPSQSEGCIGPGFKTDTDCIYDSRNAFFKLKDEITKRMQLGKVYLQIVGGR